MVDINEACENEAVKNAKGLLDYYKVHYEEIENNDYYSKMYKRCKDIINCILYSKEAYYSSSYNIERGIFKYLSTQIDLMLKMQSENPTEVIIKIKKLEIFVEIF
ncbi:hypothetical protein P9B03_09050 [Metasolibacillus meyeri]|uniref:Uncharacterized protein n=1 Tax=Metasolibacillus meyeri TaxID=1071052 RepID=A0AAW9NWC8_9BACL|nr:hypothetical protein [Metasolibacillus meyeri]MEC1178628.1 hypothetical protein [Metasolibacillus meyeri]